MTDPILNRLFGRPAIEDITESLGNMLFSGVENEDSRKFYNRMFEDLLSEKKTIISVNGSLSDEEHKNIINMISPKMVSGRLGYDFNLTGSGDSVDILSAFQTNEQKADYMTALMSMVMEIPPMLKTRAQRFFKYAVNMLELKGTAYSIKDLSMMDIEAVSDLVSSSSLSVTDKNRYLRFLTDASTYSSYMDIENCMVQIESSGILDILSGSVKVKDILHDGNVIMLNGMISDDFDKKEMLFNALFMALTKCLEKYKSTSKIAFLIRNADFIAGDYIKTMLEYNGSYKFAAYIIVEDISNYIRKNGNPILDHSKSFVVFKQGSDENAAFWSAFFGNRDVHEKSNSYTKKKGWNPFASVMDNGGVIASPRKYNSVTTTISKVNKPIYRPEIFRELRANEVMIYLREPLVRRRTRIVF